MLRKQSGIGEHMHAIDYGTQRAKTAFLLVFSIFVPTVFLN